MLILLYLSVLRCLPIFTYAYWFSFPVFLNWRVAALWFKSKEVFALNPAKNVAGTIRWLSLPLHRPWALTTWAARELGRSCAKDPTLPGSRASLGPTRGAKNSLKCWGFQMVQYRNAELRWTVLKVGTIPFKQLSQRHKTPGITNGSSNISFCGLKVMWNLLGSFRTTVKALLGTYDLVVNIYPVVQVKHVVNYHGMEYERNGQIDRFFSI